MVNPTILKEGKYTKRRLDSLKKKAQKIFDIYESQLKELFEIKNPRLAHKTDFEEKFSEFRNKKIAGKKKELSGNWIYYPWNKNLVHTLSEKENDLLRTNRNREIITRGEQQNLLDFTVAIVGLSVGGNIATTLAYNGISKKMKLADFDALETTNLNRVRTGLSDIGQRKIEIVSREILELDPLAKIKAFPNGISKKNLQSFVKGVPKTNLIFEIIDDFKLKILIRKEARKHKVPVVMLTSLGDRVLIDIERYDTDPKTKIFNGKVSEKILEEILAGEISKEDEKKYAIEVVGRQNIPPRVLSSVKDIGKSLTGRPQLMSTVTVASGLASVIARKIALGEPVSSGRKILKFDDFIK